MRRVWALCAGIAGYTVWLYFAGRRERPAIAEEYAGAFGAETKAARRRWPLALAGVTGGLVLLVVGARLLVSSATAIAGALGVSDLVIGLTVVAAGTSLPELATSVIAALRGARDLAMGNIVGSNLFNLLAVLGASALVAPHGLAVPRAALALDLPAALLVAFVALPALATGLVVARWEGALLLTGYVGYLGAVVLAGIAHPAAEAARVGLLTGLAVLTLALLAVGLAQEMRTRHKRS